MRLSKCHLENFSSYKVLDFDFSDQSLCLVHGATGSGKSSLFDAACWILFGVTAKNGTVDEVKGWYADKPTLGMLQVETKFGSILVVRVRGKGSENDLFFRETDNIGEKIRGKDLNDTQKILNERLGFDDDLYLSGAYFCEFSPSSSFFIDKPKTQRSLMNKIANLEFCSKLEEKLLEAKKLAKNEFKELHRKCTNQEAVLKSLNSTYNQLRDEGKKYDSKHEEIIKDLTLKITNFEEQSKIRLQEIQELAQKFNDEKFNEIERLNFQLQDLTGVLSPPYEIKAKILSIESTLNQLKLDKCPTCDGPRHSKDVEKYEIQLRQLRKDELRDTHYKYQIEACKKEIEDATAKINPYEMSKLPNDSEIEIYKKTLISEQAKVNPFLDQINKTFMELMETEKDLDKNCKKLANIKYHIDSLDQLCDMSHELRGVILAQSIEQIQSRTNEYLKNHFDSEISIKLDLSGSDELQVQLTKNGYNCTFRQLSKGQRCLIKLCFGVSVMKSVSNKIGVHFDNLFFDEALDGLDSNLKVRSFNLLQELAGNHNSIFIIEHSDEFKTLFNRQFRVTLESDTSEINLDES